MLPLSVLPIAGILLGVRFATSTGAASRCIARYGRSGRICFANMPLIFRYRRWLHQQRRRFGSGGGSSVWHHGENHNNDLRAGSAFTC